MNRKLRMGMVGGGRGAFIGAVHRMTAQLAGGLIVSCDVMNYLQVTETDGRPVDRSRGWCNSMGIPYFRFSTKLSQDVALDEIEDSKLILALWETELYMRKSTSHVRELCDFLKCDI